MTRKPNVPRTARAVLSEGDGGPSARELQDQIDETGEEASAPLAVKGDVVISDTPISLGAQLSRKPTHQRFSMWLIGTTPLIVHAWSFKAKREMLEKQVKATKSGRDARDPEQDFLDSLYAFDVDEKGNATTYGFPVTGVKNAIMAAAHKDKGIAKVAVMQALYLDAAMVRQRPALNNAICDMPLVRVYGTPPEMREDMVKIGAGMQKVASLAYRPQFRVWAMRISGQYNPAVIPIETLIFLVTESGLSSGLGEWRNERKGIFGSFRLANAEEERAWDDYAAGIGDLPMPVEYQSAPMKQAAE